MSDRRNQFPTLWQAILLLIFLLSILTLTMAAAQWAGLSPKIIEMHPFVLAIIYALSFGFVIRFGYRLTSAPFEEVFPWRRPDSKAAIISAVMTVVGLQILFSEVDNILRNFAPLFRNDSMSDFFNSAANPLEIIFFIVIAAPIYEELLFRGLLIFGFAKNYGNKLAVIISAVIFGLMHFDLTVFDPLHILYTTGLGLFLGLLFVKTRSLWPNIIGHAFNNGLPFIIGLLPLRIPGFNMVGQGKMVTQPLWFDLFGLLLTMGGLYLLWGHRIRESKS